MGGVGSANPRVREGSQPNTRALKPSTAGSFPPRFGGNSEDIDADLRQKNWNQLLEGELTNLPEYLFVSGEFRISTSHTLLLVHDFVGQDGSIGVKGERFRPVQFDVTFPPGTVVPELHEGSQKVTVFGKVVHAL